jgi:hypothetical protein
VTNTSIELRRNRSKFLPFHIFATFYKAVFANNIPLTTYTETCRANVFSLFNKKEKNRKKKTQHNFEQQKNEGLLSFLKKSVAFF